MSSMKLRECSKEQFISAITSDKADAFAKTFVAKANMQENWDSCIGAFSDEDELMGAIIVTVSKRSPVTANLQLLHTFAKHRRKGVGAALVEYTYYKCINSGAVYYRVSAEPGAVKFYESIGFKFWGLQKSNCSLSLFKINGKINEGIYDEQDPYVRSCLYSGKKGSLASSYQSRSTLYD